MTLEIKDTGKVKTFDNFKGFGFITREKGKDVFFFYEDVIDGIHLYPGDSVNFVVRKESKGPRAYNISKNI